MQKCAMHQNYIRFYYLTVNLDAEHIFSIPEGVCRYVEWVEKCVMRQIYVKLILKVQAILQ